MNIALIGNPNAGKSSLFNIFTGLQQKVANYPGVTVDKKVGTCTLDKSVAARIIDLPGTYSLNTNSSDERIAYEILTDPTNELYPNLVVLILDAANLKRNLLLATQVLELQLPTVIALNMNDEAEHRGIEINAAILAKTLQVPVIKINAKTGFGVSLLKSSMTNTLFKPNNNDSNFEVNLNKQQNSPQAQVIERYKKIDEIVAKVVIKKPIPTSSAFTQKIDNILLHRFWGYLIMLAIFFIVFQFLFTIAQYPMAAIENLFNWFSEELSTILPNAWYTKLLTEGVIAGISGIAVFIPQIAILFGFIAILEDSGYMSRVTFLMDKIMRVSGMNGKSIVPLVSAAACAIPAIMSARNIAHPHERLTTMLVAPLIPCSARLPVYTLLISMFAPDKTVLGIFNLQGLLLLFMYFIGYIMAMLVAFCISMYYKWQNSAVKNACESIFVIEIPVYRQPRWKNVLMTMYQKARIFVLDAGKIILVISVILWFLASYGSNEEQIISQYSNLPPPQAQLLINAQKLEDSYAGKIGKLIEPIIAPLGFDWKMGIALITSFAAREVFVGTMATIYSISGSDEDIKPLKERLLNEKNSVTQKPAYSIATICSLLIFYAFAMQCMSTIAIMKRETNSWKLPLFQLFYMTGLAYLCSFIVYQLLKV